MNNYDTFADVYDLFYGDFEDDLEMYLGLPNAPAGDTRNRQRCAVWRWRWLKAVRTGIGA
ncbi:MAG: hypothetical protein U0559_08580 [Anaerolineae bacterium]